MSNSAITSRKWDYGNKNELGYIRSRPSYNATSISAVYRDSVSKLYNNCHAASLICGWNRRCCVDARLELRCIVENNIKI
jgi:hypothetical protein